MKLSVNLNKVALFRNSRGHGNPSVLRAAETCIRAGAQGITLHWREDGRHTVERDIREVQALCEAQGVEFNLEGDCRVELVQLAYELQPTQLTLVPVTPGELTSDHGWDLPAQAPEVAPVVARARVLGIRTAVFLDADAERVEHVPALGVDRIEIYTEPYAAAFGRGRHEAELKRLRDTARKATALGLGVNAGHDLDLRNLPTLAREVPEILEVSIGHALTCDALYLGLEEAVRRYLRACRKEPVPAPSTR